MPIINHWEGSLLIRENIGEVCIEDILQSLIKLGSDPRFDNMHYLMASWDKATDIKLEVEDIEKIRSYVCAIERSNPNVRSAIYGLADEKNVSFAYLYQALSIDSKWEVKIFNSEQEARAWLFEI